VTFSPPGGVLAATAEVMLSSPCCMPSAGWVS